MKTFLYFIAIISMFFLQNSCTNKDEVPLMAEIEVLIETNPDKALEILISNYSIDKLSVDSNMQYLLYKTQAKDKNNLDISKDTMITLAGKYFKEKGINEKTAVAMYYSGRVYMEKNDYKKAMEYFLKASEQIGTESPKNYNLLGLISYYQGYLYNEQANYNLAIQYYAKARRLFRSGVNLQNENYVNIALASVYLNTDSIGQALPYCEQAVDYARTQNDSFCISEALKKIGSIYKQSGNFEKAKEYFTEAIRINTLTDDMVLKCLFLCETYLHLDLKDSSLFYINQFQEDINNSKNFIIKAKYHDYLVQLNESQGKFKNALENARLSQLYLDSATIETKENSIFEITEKYNVEKNELKYNKLIKQENLILAVTIILLLFTGLKLENALKKSKKINKELLAKEKWEIDLEVKKGKLRSLLSQRFEISKRLALISCSASNNEDSGNEDKELLIKLNEIIYGTTNADYSWDEFYILFDELFDNFSVRLKQYCPQLSSDDVHLCCLIKSGFSNAKIHYILNIAPITVRMRQTEIRKKLGIEKGVGGLVTFLDNFHQK